MDVVACETLGAGDVTAEESRFRIIDVLPDDAAVLRINLHDSGPWIADTVHAVVEDLDVAVT